MTESAHSATMAGDASCMYTDETDLYNQNGPRLYIQSLKFPELELRCTLPKDSSALLCLFTDQRNVQYDKSCDGFDNEPAINNLITTWRTFNKPLDRANVVIVIEGSVVGISGLGWIGTSKAGERVGDAGIMLDSGFRGKGYAYESLRIVIDHGFRVLGMDVIRVAARDANVAMKGLMNSKFGLMATPIDDDKFGNEWMWTITRDQWFATIHSQT